MTKGVLGRYVWRLDPYQPWRNSTLMLVRDSVFNVCVANIMYVENIGRYEVDYKVGFDQDAKVIEQSVAEQIHRMEETLAEHIAKRMS